MEVSLYSLIQQFKVGILMRFLNIYHMGIIDILKEKGLKKSAQRVAILSILQAKKMPLTENDIKTEMGDMYDRITFYRTVQTLLDADIIHRIIIDNVTVKYALNVAGGHSHVHFFCKKCHNVTCLKNVDIQTYQLPPGFSQEECEVLIKGICDKCRE